MPHLNELHQKWNEQGLTVIGVTSEGKSETDKWVDENAVQYAYAYDKGGKFSRACGVTGIPSSVLVDATGRVVYAGSPSGVTEELVRKATEGALKLGLYDLPKELAKVRTLVAKDDLAGALAEAKAVAAKPNAPEAAASAAEALTAMVASLLKAADDQAEAGDWLGAQRGYERLTKAARGLPEEATARQKLSAISSNDEAQKALKEQKALEKILAMPSRKDKEKEAQRSALEKFIKKSPDGFAGKEAQRRLGELSAAK